MEQSAGTVATGHSSLRCFLVVFYQVLEYLRFITVVFNRIYEHSLYLSHKLLLPFFQEGCRNFLQFKHRTGTEYLFLEGWR